ncbi:hypothetical protein WJX72_002948 [[Myrmecia] bisecta]|uniref:HMG box domain-containing protein n=1 Tax=[Myrmecia] bisecta TaxID=41462 RepID=A0AAW1PEK4_9CHLO
MRGYRESGVVPTVTYGGAGHAPGGSKKGKKVKTDSGEKQEKVKRKPTAFNIFVKTKIEELKRSGIKLEGDTNNNALFTRAVNEWKKFSPAEKKAFEEKFKAGGTDIELAALAAVHPSSGEAAEDSEEESSSDEEEVPTPAPTPAHVPVPAPAPAPVEKKSEKKRKAQEAAAAAATPKAEPKEELAPAKTGDEEKKAKKAKKEKKKKHKKHEEAA